MKTPAQPNLSLIRGVECLQAVLAAEAPLGSREVARRLGMEHTRVSRMLGTFCSLGLLEQTGNKRFMPGPGIHVLAAQSLKASGLLKAALPVIRRLRKEPFNVALGVLWREHVCYLYWASPKMGFEQGINGTELYPAQRSSIGRLLLSGRIKNHELFRESGENASLAVGIGNPPYAGLAFSGNIPASRIPTLVKTLQSASSEIQETLQKTNKNSPQRKDVP